MKGIKDMLKKHLGESYTDELADAIEADVFKIAGDQMVSRADFNKMKKDFGDYKKSVEDAKLATAPEDIEKLKADHAAEIERLTAARNSDRLMRSLKDAGVKNAKAVNALLALDKIEYSEEEIKGLEEQLAELKKSDGYLFANPTDNTPDGTGMPGGQNPPADNQKPITKVI